MKIIAEINSVEKSYGNSQVIKNCSFNIREGEVYGLLGVNGAGKTTLMKMMIGLQKIDRGSIRVLESEAGSGAGYLSEIGSMIENPFFYGHLNGREILKMHLCYMGKQGNISEILGMVGLDGAGDKPVSQYSLGMKQRLGIARAIIHRPKLLILDEPLNGLDPIATAEMRRLMRRLADRGTAILLSSHIIGEIKHTADRIGILAGGCIQREFSASEKLSEWNGEFEEKVVQMMRENGYEFI
ncbi:MAG: ATP-binding cassette domain-containing protein [Firmicutes bacterium]|nr:ATP-binding cassette domain-containing protein [Bacillota bacterium]